MRLFEREARGVKLTGKGHELLSHAERMLQVRRDMFEAAREQNVMSGTVRIGVAETIVQTWLPTLIELVHTAYPALVLEIEVDTTHVLRPHLLSRQIDLAFLMGPVLEARVENLPLCTYPLAWVANPQLDLGPEPVTLERIARLPIITYPSNSAPYRVVRDMLTRAGGRAAHVRQRIHVHDGAHDRGLHRHQRHRAGVPGQGTGARRAAHPAGRGRSAARAEFHRELGAGSGQPCGAPDRADGAESGRAGHRWNAGRLIRPGWRP